MTKRERWHGTDGGYNNHACHCGDCRKAHADSVASARARRTAAPVPDHVHGTPNGYGNYGCHCRSCTDAHNEAKREWYYRKTGVERKRYSKRVT